MKPNIIFRFIAVFILMGSFLESKAQSCPSISCTNSFSGSYVTVNNGETYCLSSGSWNGGVTLNAGGTIYIAPGATLTIGYSNGNGYKGTIINCGTLNVVMWGNGNTNSVNIINHGTLTSGGIQSYTGTLNNYGTFQPQQFTTNGATVNNYKKMNLTSPSLQNTSFINHDTLLVTGDFYLLNGGLLNNKVNGFASLNVNYGSTEFAGAVQNSGNMQLRNATSGSGISKKVDNYGRMKFLGNINMSGNSYFTNDSLVEVENGSLQLQGSSLLQNNKTLKISANNSNSGNLSLNSTNGQLFNNGIINVSGTIAQNAPGSKVINSCRMIAGSYFIGTGLAENRGIIWVANEFKVENMVSEFFNDVTGFVRGVNFRNSGKITGYGSFHFTGNTDFQSAGIIAGNSATTPILFFDATPTNNQIFDAFVQNNPATNTVRPSQMTPIDTTGYNCPSNATTVGFPPETDVVEKSLCANGPVQVNLDNYVAPHTPVSARVFTVQTNTVRLFDHNNSNNPTNNTTHLVIANKGVFDYDNATGLLSFTPDANFITGEVKAQYLVSNIAQGEQVAYPSPKTAIIVTISAPSAAPTISIGN